MDSYEDWLKLYNIKPPADYTGEDSVLSQIAVENNYEFVKINRRPPICGGFISNHQLLGPHVVLTFNETSRQISSKILPGEIKVLLIKYLLCSSVSSFYDRNLISGLFCATLL